MSLTTLIQIGAIPAALVVLAGLLILRKARPELAGQWFLFFLLGTAALLLLAVYIAARFPGQDERLDFWISNLLAGVTLGVLALSLLNLAYIREMKPAEKVLALILIGALAFLLVIIPRQSGGVISYLGYAALMVALIWWARAMPFLLIAAGLALFGLMNFFPLISWMSASPDPWRLLTVGLLILPGLSIALAGALVAAALERPAPPASPGASQPSWLRLVFWLRLILAGLVLAALTYLVFWSSIWDQTSDGLGGLAFSTEASLVALAVGMFMALKSSGRLKLAGLGFAVFVPLALFGAFQKGWDVSYHQITDARAARIQRALERFHQREGRYPSALTELVPWYLLSIPDPVILRGETWCYQGENDRYRLGAFYREYFSTPLSLRIYASTLAPPEPVWACESQLAERKAQYDPRSFDSLERNLPTPIPQPTSSIPIERQPVQPLVQGSVRYAGSWSPDGQTWPFGLIEGSGPQARLALHFLQSRTGQTCRSEANFSPDFALKQQYAWLPDGRLLFITSGEDLILLQPCQPGVEDRTARYPIRFQQAVAEHAQSGRVLLKSKEAYWILDGKSLEAWPVQGVTPNPYELHWDRFAWTPGGERLAISRLNGRQAEDGSTLYLVTVADGKVQLSLPMADASDQSAPIVEWLTDDELLLHGQGELRRYNFAATHPQVTNVLKDLFSLSLRYAEEITAMAALIEPGGESYHLVLRANRPPNQAVYLFHSESEQIEVLHPETNALLFFPSGEWTEMPDLENEPPEQDIFEVFQVDAGSQALSRLVVLGHLPRQYPHLWPRYLHSRRQLVFSSQQGVSLVSLAGGGLQRYWELAGGSGLSPSVWISPDENSLVVFAEGVGLYWIPLE